MSRSVSSGTGPSVTCGSLPQGSATALSSDAVEDTGVVVGTGIDPVTSRFSGARSTN
jgi:hypothetical protein